jgi:hypothetical protein
MITTEQEEPNHNFKCSVKINWIKSILCLNILLENCLDTTHRRLGFIVSSSVSEKDLQYVYILWRCEEYVHSNRIISSIYCDLDRFYLCFGL